MVYKEHIKNGQVVLEGDPALPEGASVTVAVGSPSSIRADHDAVPPAWLVEFAGIADDLPPDLSVNHDHYLYGAPKRQ